jgi:hypothetical protein
VNLAPPGLGKDLMVDYQDALDRWYETEVVKNMENPDGTSNLPDRRPIDAETGKLDNEFDDICFQEACTWTRFAVRDGEGGYTSCIFWATIEVIHKWDETKDECKLCCVMLLLFVLLLFVLCLVVVSFHLCFVINSQFELFVQLRDYASPPKQKPSQYLKLNFKWKKKRTKPLRLQMNHHQSFQTMRMKMKTLTQRTKDRHH